MTTAERLLRADLRDFRGYVSARSTRQEGSVWLNANESALPSLADPDGTSQRYPEPQPAELLKRLAAHYQVEPTQLLAGRGSDEGIDLLVRTFCEPGDGCVLIAPPTFGMYAVSAKLHGAQVIEVPLLDTPRGFIHDLDALATHTLEAKASLVFLCNPGNPTGATLDPGAISQLARRLAGRSLLVIDEAYGEYGDVASASRLLGAHDNIVVLRTLSKAHALAGARIGCVMAQASVIALLRRVQAPYPLAAPCIGMLLKALQPTALSELVDRIAVVRKERKILHKRLSGLDGVRCAYPSSGNFLLVRFDDAAAILARLLQAGIVVRDMRAYEGLDDALRISIGTPTENAAVVAVIEGNARVSA